MFLFFLIIINLSVSAFFYPEIFLRQDLRLVQGHDTAIPMQSVFWMVNQLFHGGVALFNPYDGFNNAYTHLNGGIYTPINFLIAIGYGFLSWFSQEPGKLFHHWHLLSYFGLTVIIRTVGVYLLAMRLTHSRGCSLATTVIVNAACTVSLMHMGGMMVNMLYSMLPLLLFFLYDGLVLRRVVALAAAAAWFSLCVMTAPLYALGYFYLVAHLFIVAMIVFLLSQRKKTVAWQMGLSTWQWLGLVALAAVALLPVYFWGKNLSTDFLVASSGLGATEGRFSRIANPNAILNDAARYFVNPKEFFLNAIDWTRSQWLLHGPFIGLGTLLIVLAGMALSKNRFRFVFLGVFVWMMLLNLPHQHNVGSLLAHWLMVLTDPTAFLVRSFHMSLMAWLLAWGIGIALGLKACVDLINNDKRRTTQRSGFFMGLLMALFLLAALIFPTALQAYVFLSLGLMFLFLFLAPKDFLFRKTILLAILVVLFINDAWAMKRHVQIQNADVNAGYWDGLRIKPRQHAPMFDGNPVIADYQNPRILPWRFFIRPDERPIYPLMQEFQGSFGFFYRYQPLLARATRQDSLYVPRLRIFKGIDQDAAMLQFMKQHPVTINFINNNDQVLPDAFEMKEAVLLAKQATITKRGALFHYQWPLPPQIPSYLATSIFTLDHQLWRLRFGPHEFTPAQGALVMPNTFDVNNIREGAITAAFGQEMPLEGEVVLQMQKPRAFVDLWSFSPDKLGFTYEAPDDGELLLYYPYDDKWQLLVDNVSTDIGTLGKYFMTIPVKKGVRQIHLTYWPDAPLRWAIPLSLCCGFFLLGYVFWVIARLMKEKHHDALA